MSIRGVRPQRSCFWGVRVRRSIEVHIGVRLRLSRNLGVPSYWFISPELPPFHGV